VNAIIFGAYGRARNFFEDSLPPHDPSNPSSQRDLTLVQHAIAGAVGGIANTFVVSPVELVKTQLQVQYNRPGEAATFRGPLHCAYTIWRMRGVKGIFRGFIPTLIREIPGYAGQFYTYEMLKRYLSTGGFSYVNPEKLGGKEMMLAGGMAGIGAWIFCYPQDVVKSRLQADHTGTCYPRHRWIPDGGMISAWKEVVRESGQRGLWRGFGTCVLRAFPANAAAFLGYEAVLSVFHERNVSYF
jgi:solute carrier family 25 carnitine/acylcarnitine transporter 20/29